MYLATKWQYNIKWGWDRYDQRVFETLNEAKDFITSKDGIMNYGGELVRQATVVMHVRPSGEIYGTVEVDVSPHGPFRCSTECLVYRYIGNTGDVGTIQYQAEEEHS